MTAHHPLFNRLYLPFMAIVILLLSDVCFAISLSISPRFNAPWNNLMGVKQGLPHNAVTAITQDPQGYIWLATFNGLSRFDGYQLKNYYSAHGLTDKDFRALLVDGQGTLWAGSKNGGLNRFDQTKGVFSSFNHQPGDPNSLGSNAIRALLDNGDGTLWVGTDKGLDLFDSTSGQSVRFKHDSGNPAQSLPAKPVRALLKTASGALWVGTQAGLAIYNQQTNQFRAVQLPGVQNLSMRALLEDKLGRVWIAALQGLFRYDPATEKFTSLNRHIKTPHRMLSLVLAEDGSVWGGSSHNGLYRFSPDDTVNQFRYDKSNAYALADNTLMSLHIDRGGVLWAGTFNAGVRTIALNSLAFGLFNDSIDSLNCLPGPAVSSILSEPDNTLWIGTQAGLAKVNIQSGLCQAFTPVHHALPSHEITAIYRDKQQQLWIGTAKGLVKYNADTGRFVKPDDALPGFVITFITLDKKGRLAVGTDKGLYIKEAASGRFFAVTNSTNKVQTYAFDKQRDLWLGGDDGLSRFDAEKAVLVAIGFDNRSVRALHIDSGGSAWLGTEKAGLFKYNLKTKLLQPVSALGAMPENTEFNAILADDTGNLWISSGYGMLRLNRQSGAAQLFQARDGLQGDVFLVRSAFKSADGLLYFGGTKGLNRFNPEKIQLNHKPPKVVLTEFSHFNQPVVFENRDSDFALTSPISQLKTLTLSHQDFVFGFEFAAMDFADPTSNRFAYKMQGFEPQWNYTNAYNRRANYTNLDPGSYTFRVKASNKDGIWNEQGVTLTVIVKPAPWASPWAYGAYVVILLVSIYCLYHYRTASLRKRAELLQYCVDQRTKELAQEKQVVEALLSKKNDEFANVSHEFRTPLTLVLGPVSQLLASKIDASGKQKLATVKRNGYRLLRMVDQLLDMEKFRVQTVTNKTTQALKPLLGLIAESFKDLAEQKQITFTIGTIDDVYLAFTPDALEKIILNLISNAIKYTPEGGTIHVSAIATSDKVIFTVLDSGIGIAKDKQEMVFERFHRVLDKQSESVTGAGIGLALVKELVEAHDGEITLQSEPGRGTTMSVALSTVELSRNIEAENIPCTTMNQDIISLELETLDEQRQVEPMDVDETAVADENQPSVLIVEDNPDMREYILQSLQGQFNCTVACNGRQGVETAQQQVPDIIVSDVMMPEMDGYQLTQSIKSDSKTSHIPVILLTARGDKQSRLKGWFEKADEYLTKPFDPQELQIRINSLLAIRDILRQRFNQTVFDRPIFSPGSIAGLKKAQPAAPTAEELKLQAQNLFFEKLNEVIEQVYQSQKTTIGQIACEVAMSERQLFRKLKGTLGMNPTEYLRRFRLKKACELLREGMNSSTVALEVGFASHSYFTRCFSAQYGCAPSVFGQDVIEGKVEVEDG